MDTGFDVNRQVWASNGVRNVASSFCGTVEIVELVDDAQGTWDTKYSSSFCRCSPVSRRNIEKKKPRSKPTMLNEILSSCSQASRQSQRSWRIFRRQIEETLSAEPDQPLKILVLECVQSRMHHAPGHIADTAFVTDAILRSSGVG